MTPQVKAKPMRKIAYARDTREHRKIQMDCKLAECDWSQVLVHNDVKDMVNELSDTLTLMYNECFPLIKIISRSSFYVAVNQASVQLKE